MNTPSPFDTLVDTGSCEPSHDQVAALARELWLEAGSPAHHDLEFWLEAEAELRAVCRHEFRHPHRPFAE